MQRAYGSANSSYFRRRLITEAESRPNGASMRKYTSGDDGSASVGGANNYPLSTSEISTQPATRPIFYSRFACCVAVPYNHANSHLTKTYYGNEIDECQPKTTTTSKSRDVRPFETKRALDAHSSRDSQPAAWRIDLIPPACVWNNDTCRWQQRRPKSPNIEEETSGRN